MRPTCGSCRSKVDTVQDQESVVPDHRVLLYVRKEALLSLIRRSIHREEVLFYLRGFTVGQRSCYRLSSLVLTGNILPRYRLGLFIRTASESKGKKRTPKVEGYKTRWDSTKGHRGESTDSRLGIFTIRRTKSHLTKFSFLRSICPICNSLLV